MTTGQLQLGGEHEEKKVTRLLEVKLLAHEKLELYEEERALLTEIEETSGNLKLAKEKLATNQDKIKKGSVSKDVECTLKLYYENRLVQIMDGETLIEERAMTEDEFQRDLPLQHGVVESDDSEDSSEPLTQEEAKADLEGVIRDEKKHGKPSLVDLR